MINKELAEFVLLSLRVRLDFNSGKSTDTTNANAASDLDINFVIYVIPPVITRQADIIDIRVVRTTPTDSNISNFKFFIQAGLPIQRDHDQQPPRV